MCKRQVLLFFLLLRKALTVGRFFEAEDRSKLVPKSGRRGWKKTLGECVGGTWTQLFPIARPRTQTKDERRQKKELTGELFPT